MRVHTECLTGDVFGSLRCDCGIQLDQAMQRIAEEGLGVVVYLRGHEGRGIGIGHKIRAYSLQDAGRRHRRGQRGARAPGRQPRVRHRCPDPRRPRHHHHALHDQQPLQVRRPRGLRPRHRRAGAARVGAQPGEHRATCAPSGTRWATSSKGSTTSMSTNFAVLANSRSAGDGSTARGVRIGWCAAASTTTSPHRLLDGAAERPRLHSVAESDVARVWVPGAFELPLAAKTFARRPGRRRGLPRVR